jgi:hypothetical protein
VVAFVVVEACVVELAVVELAVVTPVVVTVFPLLPQEQTSIITANITHMRLTIFLFILYLRSRF